MGLNSLFLSLSLSLSLSLGGVLQWPGTLVALRVWSTSILVSVGWVTYKFALLAKNSEYDQEIPKSQTSISTTKSKCAAS